MRALACCVIATTLASASGCHFATKHPAVTAGAVAGTIGLGTCELASSEHLACLGISGGAGLTLGLITALAIWLGYEDEPAAAPDATGPDPTNLEPAPVFVPTPDQAPTEPTPAPPTAPRPEPQPSQPSPAPEPAPQPPPP